MVSPLITTESKEWFEYDDFTVSLWPKNVHKRLARFIFKDSLSIFKFSKISAIVASDVDIVNLSFDDWTELTRFMKPSPEEPTIMFPLSGSESRSRESFEKM